MTSFSIASNHRYTTAAGERREETEWFNCTAFGRLADTCNQYLSRGQQVYVEGRLRSRQYDRRDGTPGFSLDVTVTDMQMLGRRDDQMDDGGYSGQQDRSSGGRADSGGYGGQPEPSYGGRPDSGGYGDQRGGYDDRRGAGDGAGNAGGPMDVDDLPF
jgi:single-strand DNA-binding protein